MKAPKGRKEWKEWMEDQPEDFQEEWEANNALCTTERICMRKTASEVLRDLESRIARLERQAKNPQSWKASVADMVRYFEREVGRRFKGTDFEVDSRIPSDTRGLNKEFQKTATLVFILNGKGVYLDAYEQYNRSGKAGFSFNLMSEDGMRVLYSVKKTPKPLSQKMVPKIVGMLEPFRPEEPEEPEESHEIETLKDLYRNLQEDYIDTNKVRSLLEHLFSGRSLREAFTYARGTQGRDEMESARGAKALWEKFIVPRMRDEVAKAGLSDIFHI